MTGRTHIDSADDSAERMCALAPGEQFCGYSIEGFIGSGGMGQVYLARRPGSGGTCALKLSRPSVNESDAHPGLVQSRLNHPNIVRILDRGRAEGWDYVAMEYVEGQDLDDYVASNGGRLGEREVLRILRELLSALEHAHEMGIVHRDVKPSNIMLDAQGRIKLCDFDLASYAGAAQQAGSEQTLAAGFDGTPAGTPAFMSPEQFRGAKADARSDIFAVGVAAYSMLTGHRPTVMARAPSLVVPDISPEWDDWVRMCVEYDPSDRFQSAYEAAEFLPTLMAKDVDQSPPKSGDIEAELPKDRGQVEPSLPKPDGRNEMEPVGEETHERTTEGITLKKLYLYVAGAILFFRLIELDLWAIPSVIAGGVMAGVGLLLVGSLRYCHMRLTLEGARDGGLIPISELFYGALVFVLFLAVVFWLVLLWAFVFATT